ncbi:MAG TPA: aminodeoxychorismate/anthranilate synthase component II [Bacteroidetes bacterium]|nr:aminodeoxychorismate/anthranilate synthase component II [Bacteroidota bacterium]
MKKILILDNYDSFTYNLVQYFEELTDDEIVVVRNDKIDLDEFQYFDMIVYSPGPGLPKDAGIMIESIKKYKSDKKILGVCLGHQAIGEAFGAKLKNLDKVYHGVKTGIDVLDKNDPLFSGVSEKTEVGRYHSWVIDPETLGNDFVVTSMAENNHIMSIRHKKYKIWGVQFHPESIMTVDGKKMIENFLQA